MDTKRLSCVILFIFVLFTGAVHQIASFKLTQQNVTANLEDRLVFGLSEYIKTGIETQELSAAFAELPQLPLALRTTKTNKSNMCSLCLVVARLIKDYVEKGGDKDLLLKALTKICVDTGIEKEEICKGLINLNADIFIYIVQQQQDLSPQKACSIIGQPYECPSPPENELEKWSINIPPYQGPTFFNGPKRNGDPLRIVHFSDIHYDDLYQPGGNAVCGFPLCCGKDQGDAANDDEKAGNWGDYRDCDVPWHGVLNLMDQVKTHNPDYVYFTGDVIDHRVWDTSFSKNELNHRTIYNEFKKTFKNTPVLPALGNHEPHPLDQYAPSNVTQKEFSTIWLFNLMADLWSVWLPDSAIKTVRTGGFYTVLLRPGFRVISLNSNVAYIFDWWLLYDDKDPYGQLQWLTDTLAQAEIDGESVHIIGHIPSSSKETYKPWAHQYVKIIQRFGHIISSQFCGHTHKVQMHVFFNDSNIDEPVNVQLDGGSVTPFSNVNSNYRVYSVNSNTFEIIDFEDWIFNLTEANQHSLEVPPKWFKEYSFKDAFGLESFQISELGKFVQKLAKDKELLNRFYTYKFKSSDVYIKKGCDDECNEKLLCSIVKTEPFQTELCDKIINIYRIHNNIQT